MKRIAMFFAAIAIAVSASAQGTAVTANKFADNWYMGINAGVATPTRHHTWMDDLTPTVGIRVGKNLTTVFGLAVEGEAYAESAHQFDTKTFVDCTNLSLLGTFNLSNLLCGYKGEPRCFEVTGIYGIGWGHFFGHDVKANSVTSKVALDLTLNLGAAKAWQLYLEPSLNYGIQECVPGVSSAWQYNLAKSNFQLKLGVNYKFGNSNGTHNFAIVPLRDQAEIDALNAKINGLRGELSGKDAELAAKNKQIADLQKALADCENKPAPAPVVEAKVANLQPTVVFAQGSSVVERSQQANVELIANYMKNHKDAVVKISGYASPEGSAELNQKLSEKRAEAVKTMLVNKYKIASERLVTEGLGATDKLFDEVEFNRVALFNDTTK